MNIKEECKKEKTVVLTMYKELWDLIAKENKTLELRITKPKCELPFRVIVNVTNGVGVVGEFICNDIYEIKNIEDCLNAEKNSCVNASSIFQYSRFGKRIIYGWTISNVTKYEKPINIKEFGLKRAPQTWQYLKEVSN